MMFGRDDQTAGVGAAVPLECRAVSMSPGKEQAADRTGFGGATHAATIAGRAKSGLFRGRPVEGDAVFAVVIHRAVDS